jgi:hypothetical protein
MPEIWNPVSVASWSVVVAARPEKPWSWTVRPGIEDVERFSHLLPVQVRQTVHLSHDAKG